MKTALFVFTGIVYENDSKYYTVNLTSEALHKLYFPYFDKLIVCQRIKHTDDVSNLTEVNSDDIQFICPPYKPNAISMYFLKRKKYFSFVENLVKKVDFVVQRPGILGCAAARFAEKYNKPCICEVVGHIFSSFWYHGFTGKLIALSRDFDTKRTIRKSKYVIYVTNEYLQKRYPSKGKSIGISDVEIERLDDSILDNRLKRIDSLGDSKNFKMVTVGGVNVRVKGHIYALKALKILKKKGIIITYYIVGIGDQTYLKNKAKKYGVSDQVVFTGVMEHKKIYDFLLDMDIYIQPSLHEGLPRAVVEAMSRALPCMGSSIAGIPELISDEMLFKKRDVRHICEIIGGLTTEKMKHYAKINFKKAKEFEQQVLKKKRDAFYEEFLKDNEQN